MSAVTHSDFGYPRAQGSPRPSLRAISRQQPRLSVKTVTVLVSAFVALIIVRLFVTVAIESSAYEIASLNQQNVSLGRDAAFLQEQLNVLDSPQNVAAMAAELGMVSNSRPTYLQLSDGKVWGSGKAASARSTSVATVANDLIGAYGQTPSLAGVATRSATNGETQSGSASTAAPTGIPAPFTH